MLTECVQQFCNNTASVIGYMIKNSILVSKEKKRKVGVNFYSLSI